MTLIKPNSLEEALLFLTQSLRSAECGDPRSADWLVLGAKIVAQFVDARDPNAGTCAALTSQLLEPLGGRFATGHQYLDEGDVRSGWLHYEHKDGRRAICREGQASFTVGAPAWHRTGPLVFAES